MDRSPARTKISPTGLGTRTMKEEAIPCFSVKITTKHTKVIWQVEGLSLQHFPSIESVLQEEPEENFVLFLTTSFPSPDKVRNDIMSMIIL